MNKLSEVLHYLQDVTSYQDKVTTYNVYGDSFITFHYQSSNLLILYTPFSGKLVIKAEPGSKRRNKLSKEEGRGHRTEIVYDPGVNHLVFYDYTKVETPEFKTTYRRITQYLDSAFMFQKTVLNELKFDDVSLERLFQLYEEIKEMCKGHLTKLDSTV